MRRHAHDFLFDQDFLDWLADLSPGTDAVEPDSVESDSAPPDRPESHGRHEIPALNVTPAGHCRHFTASLDMDTDDHAALLLRPEEAARLLACGRTSVYELIRTGALPSVTIGRARRIRRADLNQFVASLRRDDHHME